MSPAQDRTLPDDDPRLLQAVQAYLAELEAGRRPDRRAFTRQYPDLSAALAPYLDALDMVHAAVPLLNPPDETPLVVAGSPPIVAGSPDPATTDALPEPLGDFRIVREIGRGGMGIVYEALQRSLGRRVALKVLPFAAALDARQLQRFKNEAQAAAQLHHQHIVPVYAVGSERGVHFYAMQLIEGQNLAAVIDGLRRFELSEQPGPGLDDDATGPYTPATEDRAAWRTQFTVRRTGRASDFYRTAARLVAQAAQALDYAHNLGVVHRDVKPANLLVDGHGDVWVTDFGLAQFHAAGLTQTGDLLGTLRYMSPEQAGGQRVLTDHRTDVYSLGATLYELLTLRPIFDAPDRQGMLHRILHEEPRPPRALDAALPEELETITLKAISKAPADRYATAGELADDLHRFLRYEPIRARRATLVQRARKWLRRHPSVSVAAVVLLVLLAAGSTVSAWLIRGEQENTRAEQEKTRLAFERERQRAEEAEARFRLARRSVDKLIVLAEEELAGRPEMDGLRKRLLEEALVYYQELIQQRRDEPDAQAELTATQAHVREILDDLLVLQGAGQLALLANPGVLADLRPSAEQREQITEWSRRLATQRLEAFQKYNQLTPRERQQRFLESARANEAAITAILTPQQRDRLRQITMQLQGASAFRDPAVVTTLKLTAEQRERLRAIEAEPVFVPLPPGPKGRPRSPEEQRKANEQRARSVRERIRAVLTEEQATRWRRLTGAPFEGWSFAFHPHLRPGPFRLPR